MVPPVALEMSRGRVCDVRVEVRPHFATPPCATRKGKERRRGAMTRVRSRGLPRVRSRGRHVARRGSRVRYTPHPERRRNFTTSSQRESDEGKVRAPAELQTRASCARGGSRTHQARALGLLAEVVEQRGHVAEALGGIFPVIRGAIRRRSVVFCSFSSVPRSRAPLVFRRFREP